MKNPEKKDFLFQCLMDVLENGFGPEETRAYLADKVPAEEMEETIEAIRKGVIWRYTLKDGTVEFPRRRNA